MIKDYDQPRSAKIKLIILLIVMALFAILAFKAKRLHADELVRVNMRGVYQFDQVIVTDTYGTIRIKTWKDFVIKVPSDPGYMFQVDVFAEQTFDTFEPMYYVGDIGVRPEIIKRIENNHYRCVLFVGAMTTQVEYTRRVGELRKLLNSMVYPDGSIMILELPPGVKNGDT